ncbi:unnamed protein product, partial [Prorocentrum cordatum]
GGLYSERLAYPYLTRGGPGGPRLLEIAPRTYLFRRRCFSRMFLDEDELRYRLDGCDIIPHWDPCLAGNRRLYRHLIKLLHSKGMLVYLEELARGEDVGVFLVAKKSDQLRLTVDARRSNLQFTSPPVVSLVTAEGPARVEVELDGGPIGAGPSLGFTLGTSDITDALPPLQDRPGVVGRLPPADRACQRGRHYGRGEQRKRNLRGKTRKEDLDLGNGSG